MGLAPRAPAPRRALLRPTRRDRGARQSGSLHPALRVLRLRGVL